jgi:periplasmic protein TonB
MDAMNRIVRFQAATPLGASRDDATSTDKAPPVVLRMDNVVPFDAARSEGSAALRLPRAQNDDRPLENEQAAAITATREALPQRQPERLRWMACLTLALAFHAAAAAALLLYWHPAEDEVAGAPLILVELAPVPVAPTITPSQAPPGPPQAQTAASPPPEPPVAKPDVKPEPKPQQPVETTETVTMPQAPQAEQPVAMLPPPKPAEPPQEKKRPPSQAHEASTPSTAAHRASRAAAPAPGAAARNPNALPNWKSQLMARLERYKRYPAQAQARGEHGVAQLAFSVDRSGGVHNARIVRSSGSTTLDRATLALIARAQPLPPPPPDIRGSRVAIVVPILYSSR